MKATDWASSIRTQSVADLEGAEPAPTPPPLSDGLTPSLTVVLANIKF